MSSFDRLISQIDAFIRKFYKNQIIKGLILFVGVLLFTYLFVITLEYFGRFGSAVRASLFFGFIGVNLFILGKYILIPTLKIKSFGNRINRHQASFIIGRFFPKISDRLLNTLQLSDRMDPNSTDYELINASVQQRSSSMNMVPFTGAINLNDNKRYAVWVTPVILVMFLFGVFKPEVYTQGTERVLNFGQEYVEKAPFEFSLISENSSIEEGEDYKFEVELVGKNIPVKVYVKSTQGKFLLKRTAKNKFAGSLVQVRGNISFNFEANVNNKDYKSEKFSLNVIAKTAIGKLQATIIYPKYLGLDQEVIENAADLTIPEGTKVSWSVLTKNSEGVELWINNDVKKFTKNGFSFNRTFKNDSEAKIILRNKRNNREDTTRFDIDVIKDEYPAIQVEEVKDSIKDGVRYFSGITNDDHGLTGLRFEYVITSEDGSVRKESMNAGRVFGTESPFNFAVDFRRENVQLEDKIEYYFVVSDNDGVNGSKSTRSVSFEYKLPTLNELIEKRDEEQEELKDDLTEILEKTAKFKEDLDRLKMETLKSKQSNWNKENQVNQLQEDHKNLIDILEELQKKIKNSSEEKNQLSEIDKEILEQQELINDLLEELMDDELRGLLEQLEELMKKQDEQGLEENLEQLEMTSEEMKNQLDRSLEMLKKMQVDEKIDDIEDQLEELAKKEEDLAKKVKDEKNITDEQKSTQEEIEEEFKEIQKDLKELDSLNEELDRPMELGDPESQGEKVEEDMNDAHESMEKNKGKKAGESQNGAAEKMKEMAKNLDEAQQESNTEQQQEDIDMLRNILESLVTLSFDQEETMKNLERVSELDPAFSKYSRKQRRIVDDTRIVKDSLLALAKRQPKIAKFIDKELSQVKVNHELSLEDIDERRRRDLTIHQQYVMTSYNNLALMLNESLADMQNKAQQSKPGSGSCNKPGGKGSPKPGEGMSGESMKEMLKKQLESMKKGQSPGGKKPGDKPGQGKKTGGAGMGMGNKQIAKMAAEQGAIRRALEQMRKEMNKDGSGNGNKLNPLIEELEQQEKDLINKRLGKNMINRQKEILTRLLESDKALMERGLEEKRESKSGKNENYSNQIRFEEYNKEKLRQIELLRAVDPAYKKYYKDRANEYFNRVF
ncbi:MAG: hypothetical protein HRT57_08695 [Crocinitomicaceae bacterium]|nr:hypothetical protein [Crocinitomicaceae bacterium]